MRLRLDVLPGIALCVAVTALAKFSELAELRFAGEPYLEALVLAIILGVLIRAFWTPGPCWERGISFSAKTLLEIAVVLLGASLSADAVASLGFVVILGIALIVLVAILASYGICRALGLPQRMAILIACGNSICGNSAIAAVAPVIGAKSDDVASAIAFTAVLGIFVVLGLPILVPLLHLSLTQYGVLAGLTVYAVPQVLAATLPIGALANQVGTIVKLVRVLMLVPVVLGLSVIARHLRDEKGMLAHPDDEQTATTAIVPWFILGFLALGFLRTLGFIPQDWLKPIAMTASILTTISMAALGLGVDVRVVGEAGLRVTCAVITSLLVLGLISYALICGAGIA